MHNFIGLPAKWKLGLGALSLLLFAIGLVFFQF